MSHWTWLRFRLLATVFKTVSLPVLSHNFPWAVYSWPNTYSWILHENWLLTKAVHASLKSTSAQPDGQAIFVALPWRQADQAPVAQKRMALWGAAGLRAREVLTEALQPHLSEHWRTCSSTAGHTYLCGLADSGPRSWTAKMYFSCF